MRKVVMAWVLASLAASGCAQTGGLMGAGQSWMPTIDRSGVDPERYGRDFDECHALAQQNEETDRSQATRTSAVRTGALAAGATAIGVAATGGLAAIPIMAGTLAGVGGSWAVLGGAWGMHKADRKHREIITACLTGRGYRVLG